MSNIAEKNQEKTLQGYFRKYEPYSSKCKNNLYHYLCNNSFLVSTYTSTPQTSENKQKYPSYLTSYAGGVAHFPYEKRFEVLDKMSLDVEQKNISYWNQIAHFTNDGGCRLLQDIDCDKRILADPEIFTLAISFHNTVKEYFTEFTTKPFFIFVAKCGPRYKKGKFSTGVHLIAHANITIEQAHQITYAYSLYMERHHESLYKDIEIDSSIFKLNSKICSLRMIYSNKKDSCPYCKNEEEQRILCHFCKSAGFVISTKTYTPFTVINKDGEEDEDLFEQTHHSFSCIVKNYSIWPEDCDKRTDYAQPLDHPSYAIESKKKDNNKKKRKLQPQELLQKKTTPIKSTWVEGALQKFIRTAKYNDTCPWKNIIIDSVNISKTKKKAFITVKGAGCTNCLYNGKPHSSNRVYFELYNGYKPNGQLILRCFSKNNDCNTKSSISFKVSDELIEYVFCNKLEKDEKYSIKQTIDTYEIDDLMKFNFSNLLTKLDHTINISKKSQKEFNEQREIQKLIDFKNNL